MFINNNLYYCLSLEASFNRCKSEVAKLAASPHFKSAFVISAALTALVYASQTTQMTNSLPASPLSPLNNSANSSLPNLLNQSSSFSHTTLNQSISLPKQISNLLNLYDLYGNCLVKVLPLKDSFNNSTLTKENSTPLLNFNNLTNVTTPLPTFKQIDHLLNSYDLYGNCPVKPRPIKDLFTNRNSTEKPTPILSSTNLTFNSKNPSFILNNPTHIQNHVTVNISGSTFDACLFNNTDQKNSSTTKRSLHSEKKSNSSLVLSNGKLNITNGTCLKFAWVDLDSKATCPNTALKVDHLKTQLNIESDNYKLLLPAFVAAGISALGTDKESKKYVWAGALVWVIGNLAYERLNEYYNPSIKQSS